ncbi:glycosyltransferase family 4 protein [Paraconexibacter sp.]|uniref:glycosyltransferase family 4 protein n=1 Tax=Paraconexibacter sp. TaxID=2949640 RepID=UPI00356704F3
MGSQRVLFVHERPGDLGGSQTSMLAEAAALRDRGWEAVLLHGEEGVTDAVTGRFDDSRFAAEIFAPHPRPSARRALRGHVDETAAGVVHVHLGLHASLVSDVARRHPTVVTTHLPVCPNGARFRYAQERACERRIGARCFTQGYRSEGCATRSDDVEYDLARFALGAGYAKWMLRALRRCSAVIAPSEWQRRMLVADGLLEDRVVVLAPPIARPSAGPVPPPTDAPVVLTAGRLTTLKGAHHLLRASATITAPHVLHIAGEGPQRAHLEQLASALEISSRVRFLGALPAHALHAEMGRAAVVVVPSLWPETFGMVGPEAVLSGTPVVAYDSGGAADWARPEHGVTSVADGDIAGLGRAIESSLRLRARVPREQQARVEEWLAPPAHAEALTALYRRLSAG